MRASKAVIPAVMVGSASRFLTTTCTTASEARSKVLVSIGGRSVLSVTAVTASIPNLRADATRLQVEVFSNSKRYFGTWGEQNARPPQPAQEPKQEEPHRGHHHIDMEALKKMSAMDMFKKYGMTAVATYLSIYVATLFTIFLIVSAGIGLTADELVAKIKSWDILPDSVNHRLDSMLKGASPAMVNFAAAWVATKFTEPFRIVATAAVLPSVIRRFTNRAPPAQKALLLPLAFVSAVSSKSDKNDKIVAK